MKTGTSALRFVWPPAVYGVAALLALALTWFWPWPMLAGSSDAVRWTSKLIGAFLCVGGAGLAIAAERGFARAGTPVPPTRPTTALVTDGVYGWSRNPIYLGMTIFLIGLGLALSSWWPFIAALIAMAAVFKLAIEPEERYLAAKFGAAYEEYRARVRRWL